LLAVPKGRMAIGMVRSDGAVAASDDHHVGRFLQHCLEIRPFGRAICDAEPGAAQDLEHVLLRMITRTGVGIVKEQRVHRRLNGRIPISLPESVILQSARGQTKRAPRRRPLLSRDQNSDRYEFSPSKSDASTNAIGASRAQTKSRLPKGRLFRSPSSSRSALRRDRLLRRRPREGALSPLAIDDGFAKCSCVQPQGRQQQ